MALLFLRANSNENYFVERKQLAGRYVRCQKKKKESHLRAVKLVIFG